MAKAKKVELSVVKYDPATTCINGQVTRTEFDNVADALTAAFGQCGFELCVIIRPLYNEKTPDDKEFFREWRSLNGAHFKESRWDI